MKLTNSTILKFNKQVIKSDYCWYWTGKPGKGGYYKFSKSWAHRYAWEIAHNRSIPKNKEIRHMCHHKNCVNPAHLKIGTGKQNYADSKDLRFRKKIEKHLSHAKFYRWGN